MPFLRVVEVLPPLFPVSSKKSDALLVDARVEDFTHEVRRVRSFADVFLVANVKDPALLRLDGIHAAAMLREGLGVDAAPVIVVRDQNRSQLLSSALTGIAAELQWVMIAWGDDHSGSTGATNVRDYSSLAKAIADIALLRTRARSPTKFFAPVNVDGLSSPRGVRLAKERLLAGADLLLAQPPTTDAEETFERHVALVGEAGLKEKVLLNVFPFRSLNDARRYERTFRWRLPKQLHDAAAKGEGHLLDLERKVIRRLRSEGHPGVYVSTRGDPSIAERLLT